jgi:hypothetical protein
MTTGLRSWLDERPVAGQVLNARLLPTLTEPGKCFDGNGLILRIDSAGFRYLLQRIVVRGKRTEIGIDSADRCCPVEWFSWR